MRCSLSLKIKITKLKPTAILPSYPEPGCVGADLHACLPGIGESLAPGEAKLFSTGIAVEVPEGYELQVRSRANLGTDGLIVVLNAPVTIDANHKDEILVLLLNLGRVSRRFAHGERIAQLVLSKIDYLQWTFEEEKKKRFGK